MTTEIIIQSIIVLVSVMVGYGLGVNRKQEDL